MHVPTSKPSRLCEAPDEAKMTHATQHDMCRRLKVTGESHAHLILS